MRATIIFTAAGATVLAATIYELLARVAAAFPS